MNAGKECTKIREADNKRGEEIGLTPISPDFTVFVFTTGIRLKCVASTIRVQGEKA